jgi:hypothetical protein
MKVAVCKVSLPSAVAQQIDQQDRQVVVTGCLPADSTTDIPTAQNEITVRALPDAQVKVELRERLTNGNLSDPVSLVFQPVACVKPVPAAGAIVAASVTFEDQPDA